MILCNDDQSLDGSDCWLQPLKVTHATPRNQKCTTDSLCPNRGGEYLLENFHEHYNDTPKSMEKKRFDCNCFIIRNLVDDLGVCYCISFYYMLEKCKNNGGKIKMDGLKPP